MNADTVMFNSHAGFTVRSGPDRTYTGDCECGVSLADYGTAADLLDALDAHWEEVGK